MKKLVDVYFTYGKNSGDELGYRFIIEDNFDSRAEIIEEYGRDETYDSVEDFINGKIDVLHYETSGGDWDDPTGKYIVIRTKEDAIHSIEEQAKKEVNEINKMFE